MKYLLLDGKNVNVAGCKTCPLCNHWSEDQIGGFMLYECNHPDNLGAGPEEDMPDDHYLPGCPLSPYQSLHHLYVSAKCIYETIKTLYDNFKEWWNGRK